MGSGPWSSALLSADFVRKHHDRLGQGWEVFRTKALDLARFRDDAGFELIADALGIAYPSRTGGWDDAAAVEQKPAP